MFEFYYNRICHLKIAQPIIKDIATLQDAIYNYSRKKAISILSYTTLKYQPELDKIAVYVSGRPVVKGQENTLYSDHSGDDLIEDLDYLIKCLIIIGAVRYGVEKSIADVIKKLNEE